MQQTEKIFYSEFNFLLKSFSATDVDAVIADLQRSLENYQLLYIIDTYDIVENYMPYTKVELFSKRDINFQAQKFICYDYFFGGLNRTDTILLDEYKVELLAAKNKLNKHLREAKSVISNLNTLRNETNDYINDPNKTEDFFNNNFEVILLLLILNDKTNTILEEFFHFIRTRLLTSEIKSIKDSDNDILKEIFNSSRHSRFSVTLFSGYIQENKAKLLSAKNYDERHVYLENTFRDIQAIERVMSINEIFKTKNLKYYAIYLSSAFKTPEIMKVLQNLKRTENQKPPERFHRNIYQYFLFDRIKAEYKDDLPGAIEVLGTLRDLIAKIENGNSGQQDGVHTQKDTRQVLTIIKKLFDEKSNVIDNHFYLKVYEKYKGAFDSFNDKDAKKPLDRNEIVKIIREVEKNKSIYDAKTFDLRFSLSQLNQTYNMVDTFQGLDDFEPDYRYGNDIIRNPYQHLPLLLMIHYQSYPVIKQKLYIFLNSIIEFDRNRAVIKSQAKELVSELSLLSSADVTSKLLRSILITYLNFVAQSKSRKIPFNDLRSEIQQSESIIISDLEKQLEIIKFQFLKADFEKTTLLNRLEYSDEHHELIAEIVYLLIWLYRRNDREDEGIKIGRDILAHHHNDPRIFQGLGLCYISKVYKSVKATNSLFSETDKKNTDLAFHYLKISIEKYKLLINDNMTDNTSFLVIKNFIAVLNSLADMSLRKYEMELCNDISLVEIARKYIDEIKVFFDTIKLVYDTYPTYSATEYEIEYYEALHFFNIKEVSKAHQKIINAINRENILKKIPDSTKYIDELFFRKSSKVAELATKIFKNYS